jgi:hypothetical protein
MAKVPLPSRGQPLDLTYIYQLASGINDLASQLSPTSARYTSIDLDENRTTERIRTSDSRIVGGYTVVQYDSTTNPGGQVSFQYQFSDFAYTPIVTVTPILLGDTTTQAGSNVNVVLTRVTNSLVEGIVSFDTIGTASIGLNLLIIGIPV